MSPTTLKLGSSLGKSDKKKISALRKIENIIEITRHLTIYSLFGYIY